MIISNGAREKPWNEKSNKRRNKMEQQLNAFNFVCCKINQCSILTIRGIDEREKKRAQTKQRALVFTANAKIPLE